MHLPIIDFDSNGNIFATRETKLDLHSSFSQRTILNDWCGSNFLFLTNNSVGIENFFNPVPWCEIMGYPNAKYFWGNECNKKVEKRGRYGGCSPFAYAEYLYDSHKIKATPRYQTVFLPKRDNPFKTWLSEDPQKIGDLIDDLKGLGHDNPVYIAFPEDYEYYWTHYPREIVDKIYCLGFNGFDVDWKKKQKNILELSEVVYTNGLTSSMVYAAFCKKPVKIYKSDIHYQPDLPDDLGDLESQRKFHEATSKTYTVAWDRKPQIWRDFMTYAEDVFVNDLEDKNYWIYNFLSLDRIKQPEQLYDDLLMLHENYVRMTGDKHKDYEVLPFNKPHDLFEKTKENCEYFKPITVSPKAKDFYEKL